LRKENLDKAEKMSSSLIKNHPENPTFLDTYAWVLYTRGKYKEAKKIMERAISTGRATATHFEHYGDILYKLGDVEDAVRQWEKARGLNANSETLNKKIANKKIYESEPRVLVYRLMFSYRRLQQESCHADRHHAEDHPEHRRD
jgi:predicted Zn-dependent protease